MKMKSVAVFVCIAILFIDVSSCDGRAKRLADIVCSPGTTKITPPNYYRDNSVGWCAEAVEYLQNDVENIAYREECQRWFGGALPPKVFTVQLIYCFEFDNGTVVYRVGLCCSGTPSVLRCFTGSMDDTWHSERYQSGNLNYIINYHNQLTTCNAGEVCQTKYAYNGSEGTVSSFQLSKSCAPQTDCAALAAARTCADCAVPNPQCVDCCSTAFCNYGFTYHDTLRPTPCPPCFSSPCQNGGVCQDIDIRTFKCYCRIAWKGLVCSEPRSFCAVNHCDHEGTCYDYSDLAVGDYRCDCRLPYVGDNCEIASNLTCDTSAVMGAVGPGEVLRVGRCTPLAWSSFGHPEVYYPYSYYREFVTAWCKVSDGPEAAYRINFEMRSCSRGDFYSWTTYHSCCENRTKCISNPCLNGGTCYDWNDVGASEYRCDCPPLYVGDICEIQSQLPCNSSDAMYLSVTGGSNYVYPRSFSCTPRYKFALNQPMTVYGDVINGDCTSRISRPSDGHHFIQGTDGQIWPPHSQFEVQRCERGHIYSWVNYHICCPSCLSSPCQNDGYCIQKSYNSYICRCRFGFGGSHCEFKFDLCVITGDPHYRTFDDFMYSYQGDCKHVLVNTSTPLPGLPVFTVYGKNQHRPPISPVVSYPQYVQVEYYNILYTLPNIVGLGETFFISPTVIVRTFGQYSIIFVSPQHRGSLSGLCGNNDNIRENDLVKSDGTTTTIVDEFADSWIVPDPSDTSGSCPTKKRRRRQTVPTCEPLQEYRDKCSIINNTNGVFSRCITRMSPGIADQYYADCLMDACYSEGSSICQTIQVFALECRVAGAQVLCDTWKLSSGCADSDLCPDGLAFKCSVTPCPATCQQPDAPDECPLSNMEGCGCEPGELLFNATCVTECPVHCFYEPAHHFMSVNETYPGSSCTTVMCKECDNCTNGAEIEVLAGCLIGQRCYSGTCQMTTPRDHGNNRKSTPPGLINNTHAQACGNGNGNCDHATSPHIPPGQERTLLPEQKPIKTTKAPPKNGKKNGNSNGGGKGENKGKAKGNRKAKKSNRRRKN